MGMALGIVSYSSCFVASGKRRFDQCGPRSSAKDTFIIYVHVCLISTKEVLTLFAHGLTDYLVAVHRLLAWQCTNWEVALIFLWRRITLWIVDCS